jgi:hypothetical protein
MDPKNPIVALKKKYTHSVTTDLVTLSSQSIRTTMTIKWEELTIAHIIVFSSDPFCFLFFGDDHPLHLRLHDRQIYS